jgi:hypothetical protein
MKRAWQIVGIGFVGLLLLLAMLACVVVWHIIAGRYNSQKDFWDVVTALATVAAAIIALGIALSQGSARAREDRVRAEMLASRLFPRLTVAEAECKTVGELLFFYSAQERSDAEALLTILVRIRKMDLKLSTTDLATLAPLPNSCAAQLAHAIGHIEAIQSAINAILEEERMRAFDDEETERWCDWAASARVGFKAALHQCSLVASQLTRGTGDNLVDQLSRDLDF